MADNSSTTTSHSITQKTMESEVSSNSTALAEIKLDPEALPTTGGVAGKPAIEEDEAEWSVKSALQVLGGFMLLFNSWGYLNSFGVFQNYYKTVLIPESSDSQISWIGGMQAFLLLLGSAFVGRLFDAGYLRSSVITGSILLVFTTCMTSLSTEWYQLFLSQGIGAGVAVGILFIPGVATVSTWFKRHRAGAIGIVASGSSVGAVVLPIVLGRLIPRIGFGWAVRAVALIQLITLLIAIVTLHSRLAPRKAGPWVEPSAFKQKSYSLFIVGAFLAFWGIYTPFFYATSFMTRVGAPENVTTYILAIMNASSVFGRIFPNLVADVFGPINVLIPTVISAAILLFGWLGISTWQGFLVFGIFYGFFSGTLVSLPPACVVSLTEVTDLNKVGTRMGMAFSIVSFAVLTGTPIAGALISHDNGGFTDSIIFSAVVMIAGFSFLTLSRIARVGTALNKKC